MCDVRDKMFPHPRILCSGRPQTTVAKVSNPLINSNVVMPDRLLFYLSFTRHLWSVMVRRISLRVWNSIGGLSCVGLKILRCFSCLIVIEHEGMNIRANFRRIAQIPYRRWVILHVMSRKLTHSAIEEGLCRPVLWDCSFKAPRVGVHLPPWRWWQKIMRESLYMTKGRWACFDISS